MDDILCELSGDEWNWASLQFHIIISGWRIMPGWNRAHNFHPSVCFHFWRNFTLRFYSLSSCRASTIICCSVAPKMLNSTRWQQKGRKNKHLANERDNYVMSYLRLSMWSIFIFPINTISVQPMEAHTETERAFSVQLERRSKHLWPLKIG